MKIKANYGEKEKNYFPSLMIVKDCNLIILATGYNEFKTCIIGTCLQPGSTNHPVGWFDKGWSIFGFEIYDGTITLSND